MFLINVGQHPARENLASSIYEPLDLETENYEEHSDEWLKELMQMSFHQVDKEDTLSVKNYLKDKNSYHLYEYLI